MARKYVDCREAPELHCSVAVSADTENELIEAAVQHATSVHGAKDTPDFREQVRRHIKEGHPRA